ncbi:hypothetical protein SRABI128_03582 [Microbacterium sp. Bi128]|nr:hypothetical protein SRABI128_03582 [Microbacterium sp. Bi128]
MLRIVSSDSAMYAPTSLNTRASGSPLSQPARPPARLSVGSPALGAGRPPATWQNPAIAMTNRAKPMPMRPLSCTDEGCRNSHPASRSSSTGKTKATRPMSPPKL